MSTAPHGNVRGRSLYSRRGLCAAKAPQSTRGIATVEIAAVLAVTFIMGALAVSAYRTYAVRQEVSSSLAAVAPIQDAVVNAFKLTGVPPASEADVPGLLHMPKPLHPFIQAVTIKHARIELLFGEHADATLRGRSVHLTPYETADAQVIWVCGDGPADAGLYPLGFLAGTNRTAELSATVEFRYLPVECR